MSATEELRRLLDERGVEWAAIHDTCTSREMPVGNQMRDGFRVPVWYDGTLHIECVMSPTQAIAATLGRGECEMEYVSDFMSWHCKACDMMDMAPHNPKPRYCKWCGAKVVDA